MRSLTLKDPAFLPDKLLDSADVYLNVDDYNGVGSLLDRGKHKLHPRYGTGGTRQITPAPGGNALNLNGGTNNHAVVLNSEALHWTGGVLEVVSKINPRTITNNYAIGAKEISANATGINWRVEFLNGGIMRMLAGDGTVLKGSGATAVAPVVANEDVWLKWICDPTAGTMQYYTSVDGDVWAQVGSTINVGAFTPATNSKVIWLGSYGAGFFDGFIYKFKVSVDGVVALDVDFTKVKEHSQKFVCDTDQVVSLSYHQAMVVDGELALPGIENPGNYVQFQQTDEKNPYADLTIQIQHAADSVSLTNRCLVHKRGAGSTGWQLRMSASAAKQIEFIYFVLGGVQVATSINWPYADGEMAWLQVEHLPTGETIFSHAPAQEDVPTAWTQLGPTRINAAGRIDESTTNIECGQMGGSAYYAGRIRNLRVLHSALRIVDVDFSKVKDCSFDFVDSVNNVAHVLSTSAVGADASDPQFLPFEGRKYVYLPGTGVNDITTPDAPANSFMHDIYIAAEIAPDDWTPAGVNTIIAKDNGSAGNRAWRFYLNAVGTLSFIWYPDGTTASAVGATSSVIVPGLDGRPLFVNVLGVLDDGSGHGVFNFYYSYDENEWFKLGDTITTAAPVSWVDGNSPISIGTYGGGGTGVFKGKIYKVEVRSAVDNTHILDFNAEDVNENGTSAIASTGETWSINRSTTGRKSVVVDRSVLSAGPDDALIVKNHDILNFNANEDFTIFFAFRSFDAGTAWQRWLDKRGASGAGWLLSRQGSAPRQAYGFIGNAAGAGQDIGSVETLPAPSYSLGEDTVFSFKRDCLNNTLSITDGVTTGYNTGGSGASLDLRNTLDLAIFGGTTFADLEFFGFALFRKALNPEEELRAIKEFKQKVH